MNTPLLALVAALAASGAQAQAPLRASAAADLEAKVALESSVEKRLQDVLRRLLGADEVVVVVNADLLSDAERPDTEILPGVSAKQAPGQVTAFGLPASMVRRLSVVILVDRSVPDESVELARKTAERMVGLRPDRGDALSVERMDFRKTPAPPAPRETLLSPRGVWSLAWIVTAVVGLLLLTRRFFEPLVSAIKEGADALKTSRASPGLRQDPAGFGATPLDPTRPLAEAPARPAPSDNERVLPFSFIQERDVPTLVTLLENQSAQMAAIIIHFLPAAYASTALDAMPEARRKEVVSLMTTPMLLDMTHVQALEATIRASIDCLIGGEDKLADILAESPVRLQNELLAALREADQALGERILKRLIVLDDVARLDDAGLTTLSRAVPLKSMAVALKTSPELATHVLGRLKSGLGDWLKQEIELAGEVPERARDLEVRRVVSALTGLVREGRVALRKAGAPVNGNGNGAAHADAPIEPFPGQAQ
ncbi:MAG: FliG C-terminal domain-containing protein [Elusimicrobiota bacterium]|nr:FliG C-terminal domain-containing protein [Elusimicrobiota bacterium]